MSGILNREEGRTLIVDMNDVRFQAWEGATTAIAADNLRGCSVALLASRKGAILAHVAMVGDANTSALMNRFASLYDQQKAAYPPRETETWLIVTQIDFGPESRTYIADVQQKIMSDKLAELKLGVINDHIYTFRHRSAKDSPTFPGKATIFVDGGEGRLRIYIQDELKATF